MGDIASVFSPQGYVRIVTSGVSFSFPLLRYFHLMKHDLERRLAPYTSHMLPL